MSDRVERAVEAVSVGQPVTRQVNSEMTRDEQLQFARTLWEGGGGASPTGRPGEYTKIVGGAEVTFRMVNGERQVTDIVFNGKDIYDTPEDARRNLARAQSPTGGSNNRDNRGIGSDSRYSRPLPQDGAETPESARARADYERCLQGSSNPSSNVERVVCAATAGHKIPGVQDKILPDLELTYSGTKP